MIFQQAALARPKGVQPVVSNHRLSAVFSFSRRLSPPKPFEPTSFQLVVVQFAYDSLRRAAIRGKVHSHAGLGELGRWDETGKQHHYPVQQEKRRLVAMTHKAPPKETRL